ncbi:hypothetical protein HaLaN_30633 [Haematococcus lacustris]|uniref:Uncharacterized protein n=1 Tax=Haematococcus lacustris TaxID=44745 RepID=A0A6A0AFZ3_HAELA|nr:hypothetical protein HaLaN_30633 [Haematococcus lacustris]
MHDCAVLLCCCSACIAQVLPPSPFTQFLSCLATLSCASCDLAVMCCLPRFTESPPRHNGLPRPWLCCRSSVQPVGAGAPEAATTSQGAALASLVATLDTGSTDLGADLGPLCSMAEPLWLSDSTAVRCEVLAAANGQAALGPAAEHVKFSANGFLQPVRVLAVLHRVTAQQAEGVKKTKPVIAGVHLGEELPLGALPPPTYHLVAQCACGVSMCGAMPAAGPGCDLLVMSAGQ